MGFKSPVRVRNSKEISIPKDHPYPISSTGLCAETLTMPVEVNHECKSRQSSEQRREAPFVAASSSTVQGVNYRVICDVEFSLDAAAELLRIAEVVGFAVLVPQAADAIRQQLEYDPVDKGEFLSEGLYDSTSNLFVRSS